MLSKKLRIMWLLIAIGIVGMWIFLFTASPFDSGITAIIISFSLGLFMFSCTFALDKYAWEKMKNNFAKNKNGLVNDKKELNINNAYSKDLATIQQTAVIDDIQFKDYSNADYNDAYDYERYVAATLLMTGRFAEVKITKKSGDYGADIICKDEKGNNWAVQCKMYSNPVGYKAIQEVVSGMHYYNCQYGMVVTTSTFTNQAIDAARKIGIELIPNYK